MIVQGSEDGGELARPRREEGCPEEGETASKRDRATCGYKAYTIIKGKQRVLHLCSRCSVSLRSPVLDMTALGEVGPECSS